MTHVRGSAAGCLATCSGSSFGQCFGRSFGHLHSVELISHAELRLKTLGCRLIVRLKDGLEPEQFVVVF